MEQNNMVMKVQGPGTGLMKVSGILMIIFGALGFIFSLVGRAAIAVLEMVVSQATDQSVVDAFSKYSLASTLSIVLGLLTLVTGILAVVLCRKLAKGMPALIFSVLVIVLLVVTNFINMSAVNTLNEALQTGLNSFGFSAILSLLSGIVLPLLVIIGVMKNKKAA